MPSPGSSAAASAADRAGRSAPGQDPPTRRRGVPELAEEEAPNRRRGPGGIDEALGARRMHETARAERRSDGALSEGPPVTWR